MKVLFPHGEASQDEIEMMSRFAIEGRKRVKDQLLRIDPTYSQVNFDYQSPAENDVTMVKTLEEKNLRPPLLQGLAGRGRNG